MFCRLHSKLYRIYQLITSQHPASEHTRNIFSVTSLVSKLPLFPAKEEQKNIFFAFARAITLKGSKSQNKLLLLTKTNMQFYSN